MPTYRKYRKYELTNEQARTLRAALAETMPAAFENAAGREVSIGNDDDHYCHVPLEGDASLSSIEPDLESMVWTLIGRDDADGSMHFTVSVKANIGLDGTIFRACPVIEDDSMSILDKDWNDHYIRVLINHACTLHFDVMVSGAFDQIVRMELDSATLDDHV